MAKWLVLCLASFLGAIACGSSDESPGETGGSCTAPSCSGCNGCLEECVCNTGDANACATACASAGGSGGFGTGGTGTGGSVGTGTGGTGTGGTGTGGTGTGGAGGGASTGRCSEAPPPGAPTAPPPKPYTGGTCPTLPRTTGPVTIQSNGARQFILVVPADLTDGEQLPIIFLWHWMGGDANSFLTRGEVQNAVNAQRFIAVIPESLGSLFKWPFSAADSDAALQTELVFFDDMLSCVSAQFNVNSNCVSTAGVSAGALWSGQLAGHRGEYLSSFLSLSGGTGGLIKPWAHPGHKMPAIVLWGGPTDDCAGILKFQETSMDLATNLQNDGHFFVECIHNCGHSQPPLDVSEGSAFGALWSFALDHPYWLAPGASPYTSGGLPAGMPAWCGMGLGSATPRTGTCPGASEC
jgi:hypothetical protein